MKNHLLCKYLLLMLVSFAPALNAKAANFSGTYVGGSIDSHSVNFDWKPSQTIYSPYSYETVSSAQSKNSIGGSVIFGTGFRFLSNGYLGLEGQFLINKDIDAGEYGKDNKADVAKINPYSGINARLGVVMYDKFMPYLLVGSETARYKVSPYDSMKDSLASTDFNQTGTIFGIKYGLGTDFAMTDKLNIRLEYYQTSYGEESKTVNYQNGKLYDSWKFENNTFRIGLIYNI